MLKNALVHIIVLPVDCNMIFTGFLTHTHIETYWWIWCLFPMSGIELYFYTTLDCDKVYRSIWSWKTGNVIIF